MQDVNILPLVVRDPENALQMADQNHYTFQQFGIVALKNPFAHENL